MVKIWPSLYRLSFRERKRKKEKGARRGSSLLERDRLTNDRVLLLSRGGRKEEEGACKMGEEREREIVRTIELIIVAGREMIGPDFTVLSY